jgi:hypothetical protein
MTRVPFAILAVAVVGLVAGGAYVALAGTGGGPAKPTIRSQPGKLTNEAVATFTYTSRNAVAFSCSLDGSTAAACGSGSSGAYTTPSPLADGPHTFSVVAEAGGAVSRPSTRAWTIDTVAPPAPVFTITPVPGARRIRFKYRDAEKVRFACRLDGAPYARCGGAKSYKTVSPGAHTFCVEALDRAGNASVPACFTWQASAGPADFSISGSPPAGVRLYPGGSAVPVDLVFTNPNPVPITVQSVTVTVAGTSAGGCAASGFSVTRQLNATPTVPAASTRSLQELGVAQSDWPQLRMADAGNQDMCQGATVDLDYAGTATG